MRSRKGSAFRRMRLGTPLPHQWHAWRGPPATLCGGGGGVGNGGAVARAFARTITVGAARLARDATL